MAEYKRRNIGYLFPNIPDPLVPDLDDPLRSAGDEDVWDECVPLYVVHRHVMGIEGIEISDKKNVNTNDYDKDDNSDENCVVQRYTIPSSVPTRNTVSSSGLKDIALILSGAL